MSTQSSEYQPGDPLGSADWRKMNETIDDHVHRYLLRGDRGSFARLLGEAWCLADSINRLKLENVFPNIFDPRNNT